MHRKGLLTLFFVCGLSIYFGGACLAQRPSQPNIVFVMVDDLGYGDLSCYGQKGFSTPHLDRMAEEGLRFTDAYSGCTVCAPARSTLMTGLHTGHTPVRGNTGGIALPGNSATLAEGLKLSGYVCGGFGKWGLGDLDTEGVPENQGFSRFFGYYHQIHAHNYYPEYLIDTGVKTWLPAHFGLKNSEFGPGAFPTTYRGKRLQFSHDLIKQAMFEWIRENADRPFFCYAPWTPPHGRYEFPETDPAWNQVKDKPWPIQAKVHAAFALRIDRDMGDLFSLLIELNIDEKTMVFFCSDNGAASRFDGSLNSSGPLKGQKRSMYEGGIRVPFLVRWPGVVAPGRTSSEPIYFPDMYPTLIELAASRRGRPRRVDGVSFAPLIRGQSDKVNRRSDDFLYWELPQYNWQERKYDGTLKQAMRQGRWKLVRDNSRESWEVYDLQTDLGETQDLAEESGVIIRKAESWLRRFRANPMDQVEPEMPEGRRFR